MSVSIRSTSTGSGPSGSFFFVPRPAGLAEGMGLLAFIAVDSGGAPTITGGAWQLLGRVEGPSTALSAVDVWWRLAGASEPLLYGVSIGSTADGVAVIAALEGAAATPPTVVEGAVVSSQSTVSSPSASPSSPAGLDLRWVAGIPNEAFISWSTPSGFTELADLQSEDEVGGSLCWRAISSTTATGVRDHVATALLQYGASLTVLVEPAELPLPEPPVIPSFAPGRGTSAYRYVFTDLLAGTYLGDLDLTGVSFDKRILQPGQLSATIDVPNRDVGDLVAQMFPIDETVLDRGPGVITCQIFREGECWGEYWITGAQYSRSRRDTPKIAIRGSTLDAYLAHAEIQEDLTYTGQDQVAIARALLSHLMDDAHADLGLVLQSGSSGVARDRAYLESEGATYGQRLIELAQTDDGFEWMINLELVSGALQRQWVWGYPKLGVLDPPPHVFVDSAHGGDILEWSEEIDALRGATRWRARGGTVSSDASTTSTPLISTAHEATAHLAAGWPRLDRTLSYSSVTVQQTLEDYAAFWTARAAGALRVDQATVAIGAMPSLTPNSLGDTARFYLDNEWHTETWRTRRIIGIGITPTSRSSGKEEAKLVLEGEETPGA